MTIDVDEKVFRVAAENVRFRSRLMEFAKESNRIDGITNAEANERMFEKLCVFLKLETLTVENVCEFNEWGVLRDKEGMNVRVGNFYPEKGGLKLFYEFEDLIESIESLDSFDAHKQFELIHPFTDGNGPTGRAIWLWQMVNQNNYDLSLGFLHKHYYQSLVS
jgi:hypothetical protein